MCAGWWLLVGSLMDVRRLVAVGGLPDGCAQVGGCWWAA